MGKKIYDSLKRVAVALTIIMLCSTNIAYGFTIGSMVNNTAFHGPYGGAMGTWVKFMKVFYGLDIKLCTAEEYQTIVTSPEYKENMECFPEESSIKIMHGIVVVKLDEEPYLPY